MDTTKYDLRKAFGYLRVSSNGQSEGDGFPRQRGTIKRWAAANGIVIVQWFEEKGVSGKTDLENRPALQELMVALASNGVRTVLIEKLDRLARDLMVQETILAEFRKQGFEVVSVMEPNLCSEDPSRVLVRQIFGAIGQYERVMIVSKLRAARQRKKTQTGRCEGRKVFGATDMEKFTIRCMRQLQSDGLNYSQIAERLNRQGLKTQTGSKWFPATVSRTLARS
jgi:DNA invertase Pin-like site-specific DNA recombinase